MGATRVLPSRELIDAVLGIGKAPEGSSVALGERIYRPTVELQTAGKLFGYMRVDEYAAIMGMIDHLWENNQTNLQRWASGDTCEFFQWVGKQPYKRHRNGYSWVNSVKSVPSEMELAWREANTFASSTFEQRMRSIDRDIIRALQGELSGVPPAYITGATHRKSEGDKALREEIGTNRKVYPRNFPYRKNGNKGKFAQALSEAITEKMATFPREIPEMKRPEGGLF